MNEIWSNTKVISLYFDPRVRRYVGGAWLGNTTPIWPQEGEKYGACMNRGLRPTPAILVGLPSPAAFLFKAMFWSTSDVLAQTRRRLEAHAAPYALLPTLPDLDRPEDLACFPGLLA